MIDAIGPAPSFGRVRWQELTDLLDQDGNRERASAFVERPRHSPRWIAINASGDRRHAAHKVVRARAQTWSSNDGTHAAKVARTEKAHADFR